MSTISKKSKNSSPQKKSEITRIQQILTDNHFPCGPVDGIFGPRTESAIIKFQEASNLSPTPLTVDGIVGPKTLHDLEILSSTHRISQNFKSSEFACKGISGKDCNCDNAAHVQRTLLEHLESYRSSSLNHNYPILILCGYRCAPHNKSVGGAKDSQHLRGLAADPGNIYNSSPAALLQYFDGVGISPKNDYKVIHIDVRGYKVLFHE